MIHILVLGVLIIIARLCPRTFAYLLTLNILQYAYNYLHLRVEETVLREVNNLPKVTHLVSGRTNSKPGPSDSRMQTLPHRTMPAV